MQRRVVAERVQFSYFCCRAPEVQPTVTGGKAESDLGDEDILEDLLGDMDVSMTSFTAQHTRSEDDVLEELLS